MPACILKRPAQIAYPAMKVPPHNFCSTTIIDSDLDLTMPKTRGISHPMFTRITLTHYLIKDANNSLSSTAHVGQIADFIKFDEQLRHHGGITSLQSMPVGFIEFSQLWNRGVRENDRRRISEVYIPEDTNKYEAQISNVPVRVMDFFITADQVGLAPPPAHADKSQAEIVQEFASLMAEQ
jgi:hypothetical protein